MHYHRAMAFTSFNEHECLAVSKEPPIDLTADGPLVRAAMSSKEQVQRTIFLFAKQAEKSRIHEGNTTKVKRLDHITQSIPLVIKYQGCITFTKDHAAICLFSTTAKNFLKTDRIRT